MHSIGKLPIACLLATLLFAVRVIAAEEFRVVTYNLNAYSDATRSGRGLKTAESKRMVREIILAMRPDVLALQEVGGMPSLIELQSSLESAGLDLPHREIVSGHDTNNHIAILSRFPLTARYPQTNNSFLIGNRRFRVSRGFGIVDVLVNANYSFTLIAAHLKSKRPVPTADQGELRTREARLLRELINQRLSVNPNTNFVVLGDLNDTPESVSTRTVLGSGASALVDTHPAERLIGCQTFPSNDVQTPTLVGKDVPDAGWTYFFKAEKSARRIDYVLVSRGMAQEWNPNQTHVVAHPGWLVASDHRPIVATFEARDR